MNSPRANRRRPLKWLIVAGAIVVAIWLVVALWVVLESLLFL